MSLRGHIENISGNCGILSVMNYGGYERLKISRYYSAGFLLCSFIENTLCKSYYDEFCNRYPILYQSPVRLNKNSGNHFFFVIFDIK